MTSFSPSISSANGRVRDIGPRVKYVFGRIGIYVSAILIGLFAVGPILWMFLTALKPNPEIFTSTPVFVPSQVLWQRFVAVVTGDFGLHLVNSVIVSFGTVSLSVIAAAMAGWVLARFRIPFKRYLLILILGAQMFPFVVLLIPLFIVMRQLGLLGTHSGLILAYLSFTTPLVVWILRGFFMSIPVDVEEVAMVDGATRAQAFRKIILPMALPGIAAASVFGFISAWNEFLFALSFNRNNPEMHTLPVSLQQFIGRDTTDWGMIMAASVIFTVPVIVFFLLTHKHMMRGMVVGAVKG
ncbi:MAG: carbohydrate ABC transporter permease [Spirochaetales bacterium]